MKLFPGLLVAVVSLLFSSLTFGQGAAVPGPRQPTATVPGGTARPGLPPRDIARPQTGTARLRGRVVSLESGTPLRRAQVSIAGAEGQLRRLTTTDGEGRYDFVELPGGRFSMSANKAGYVTLQYGQKRPNEGGTPVALTDGQTLEGIDFALPRGGVISGRVTDEFGEPIASAQVQVQRHQYAPDGQRRAMMSGMATSDDRGEFRVFGLMPGEYVVNAGVRATNMFAGASNPNDVNEGYPPTYYPGTINPTEAQTISLAVGQEMSVHFSLLPARMMRVSGTVVDSEGRPVTGMPVMLRSAAGAAGMTVSGGMVTPDGTFSISGVAPGEYLIEVRPQSRPGVLPEFASIPIVVGGGDLTGVRVVTGRGATVTGRVVFEGTPPRTGALTPLRVFLSAADPSFPIMMGAGDPLSNGTVGDDGTFQLTGVVPGAAYFTATAPPGWAVKAISVDGEDITDVPYDISDKETVSGVRIVLTDRLTNVSGRVTADRQPAKDYVVVIQPEQVKEGVQAGRLIRLVRPDTNGGFQVRGIRPGRYIATAVESLEQGRQFVPEVQLRLRQSGRAFSIAEGGTATLALELTAGL